MKIALKLSINSVTIFWILLWGINFLNLQREILIGGGIFAIILMYHYKAISIESVKKLFVVFLFSITYAIAIFGSGEKGIGFVIMYAVVPSSSFVIGYYYVKSKKGDVYEMLELFDVIVAGMFIYATLNMLYLIMNGWSYSLRGTYDIWTGNHVNATNQGGYFALTATYLPVVIFCCKKLSKPRLIIYSAEIISSIIYTLLLANRTYFIILAAEIIVSYIMLLLNAKNKSVFIIKSIVITIITVTICTVLYQIDFMNIQTFWKSSTFYTRMQYMGTQYDVTLAENDRFPTWIKTIETIPMHLFGGKPNGVTISYAHNMWLDIQWVAGIIPFGLMIMITVMFLNIAKKIFLEHKKDTYIKIFIVSYTICIMLECAVEPIVEGFYYIFTIFFLMFGASCATINKGKL